MKFRVTHKTDYQYQNSVSFCYNAACLLPGSNSYQTCFSRQLNVVPKPSYYRERIDFFGNQLSLFSIQKAHQAISITAVSEVEVHAPDTKNLSMSLPWERVLENLQKPADESLYFIKQYCLDSSLASTSQALHLYAEKSFPPNRPVLLAVQDLMSRIYQDFEYSPDFTTVSTPLYDVLEHRKGVCQDFAHLAIACIRSMGLPARYVSGYLETLPPPGKPRIIGADASHAWFAAYDPVLGWVEFDPTNNQIPKLQHVRTAYGRDYSDVTPLKGVLYGGGKHQLHVSVDVCPVSDSSEKI